MFLGKGVLEICCNFTGEHPCRGVISIKLLCNFIKITFRHECSPITLLHIFRTPFHENTFGWLFLKRGIIPFYVSQAFLLFPSTTNLASSSHWEKKLVFPDFSKICQSCAKVWNCYGCNEKFPIMKVVYLQLFKVYRVSMKILQ